MPDSINVLAITCAVIAGISLIAALAALRHRLIFRTLARLVFALVWVALALLFAAVSIGIQGYRALTREETAATVRVETAGAQRFKAHFRFADGREATYDLVGDELYVDAHILKWKPIANIVGLHTAYELDRVAGRYSDIEQERNAPRTVFPLAPERDVDLFTLRQRYAFLSPLLDTEYGSATFILASEPADFDVRVSTSGLLVRKKQPSGNQ